MSIRLFCLTAAALVFVAGTTVLSEGTQDQRSDEAEDVLMREYAEAQLKLSEVQLQIRLEGNEKVPGLYSEREIDRSKMNVAVAQTQLKLMMAPGSDAIDLHLKHAQEKAAVTHSDYQRALAARAEVPSTYSDLQIKEFELKAEVAQIRLAIWSNPQTNMLSLMDHMHWQIERVSEEVLDLQRRMDKIEQAH